LIWRTLSNQVQPLKWLKKTVLQFLLAQFGGHNRSYEMVAAAAATVVVTVTMTGPGRGRGHGGITTRK
jgi:hypothetical protein